MSAAPAATKAHRWPHAATFAAACVPAFGLMLSFLPSRYDIRRPDPGGEWTAFFGIVATMICHAVTGRWTSYHCLKAVVLEKEPKKWRLLIFLLLVASIPVALRWAGV